MEKFINYMFGALVVLAMVPFTIIYGLLVAVLSLLILAFAAVISVLAACYHLIIAPVNAYTTWRDKKRKKELLCG